MLLKKLANENTHLTNQHRLSDLSQAKSADEKAFNIRPKQLLLFYPCTL